MINISKDVNNMIQLKNYQKEMYYNILYNKFVAMFSVDANEPLFNPSFDCYLKMHNINNIFEFILWVKSIAKEVTKKDIQVSINDKRINKNEKDFVMYITRSTLIENGIYISFFPKESYNSWESFL